jgi:hypothetical protein
MVDNAPGQPDKSIQVKLVLLGTSSKPALSRYPRACSLFANHSPRRGRCWQIFRRAAFRAYFLVLERLNFVRLSAPPHPQVSDEFQPNKEPTIGAAFLTQKCRLEDVVLRYEIWDTAGQERFHSLAVRPPTHTFPLKILLTRVLCSYRIG